MASAKTYEYTTDDIYVLPDGKRAELIDGRIYDMSPPGVVHQRILTKLVKEISNYIEKKGGSCEVFPAPFAVFLNADNRNYLEPDISVICDPDKLDEKGCNGAPDWIIEIVSKGTKHMDYGIKLFKYRTAGVREYWIVNPLTGIINVFDFEKDEKSDQYLFEEEITSCIYSDFKVCVADMLKLPGEKER